MENNVVNINAIPLATKKPKEILTALKQQLDEGNLNDDDILKFYVAVDKMAKVRDAIKKDLTLKQSAENGTKVLKGENIFGCEANISVTKTTYECNNPIAIFMKDLAIIVKEHDTLSAREKVIKENEEVTINVNTLVEKINTLLETLYSYHNTSYILTPAITKQTEGLKITQIR